MRFFLPILIAATAVPAQAANRSFTITSFDRVRVEGPYRVSLATNRAPFARASGSSAALDNVSVEVQGRTLVVKRSQSSWGGYPGADSGPVDISVGTPEISDATVNGSGSLVIDRVRGLKFALLVNGAGSAEIASVDTDQAKVAVRGTGSIRLNGKALTLTAAADGPSLLDLSGLGTKDLTLTASGPTKVRALATETAKVTVAGAAVIDLEGGPACTNRVEGSATVSGCR
jgi:hypothetical protein